MLLSLVRTAEGALTLLARHPRPTQDLCILEYTETKYPMLPSLSYGMTLAPCNSIHMCVQRSSFQAEYPAISTLGLSAALTAAGWSNKSAEIKSVSTEIELTKENKAEVKKYFTSLFESHGSNKNVSEFVERVLKVGDDDAVEALFNNVWEYGILYAAPVLRKYFQDAVYSAYADVNSLSDEQAPSAKTALSAMYSCAACNSTAEAKKLRTDMGLTLNGFKQVATLMATACYKGLEGSKNQIFGACLVLKCLIDGFVPAAYTEACAKWAKEFVEEGTKYKRLKESGVSVDLTGFFY